MDRFSETATFSPKDVADALKDYANGRTGYGRVSSENVDGAYEVISHLLGISEDALGVYVSQPIPELRAKELEWQLCGDLHPIDYGGTFVKRHPDECGGYEFIRIVVTDDGAGHDTRYLFHGVMMYPEDYFDKEYVGEAARDCGLISTRAYFSKYPADFVDTVFDNIGAYGVLNFAPTNVNGQGEYSQDWATFVASVEEIVNFLKEHNIPKRYWDDIEFDDKDDENE